MPLNQSEIDRIVQGVIDLQRKTPKDHTTGRFKKLPEYTPTYLHAVEMMERIQVHAVWGIVPEKLLRKRAPNQTEEEVQYGLNNYKQISLPVFTDLLSTIQRAFFDNNWSIEYPEQSGETLQEYLETGIKNTPLQMSLEEWFKGVVPDISMIDAMGCVAIRPWRISTVEENGEQVISGDAFEPIPYYFDSTQVVGYKEGEWYLFERKDRSTVYIGDRPVQEGLIYEFYDKTTVWIITQVGLKKDYQFDYLPFYTHDFNEVPVTRLKGKPQYLQSETIWQSPFLAAVDILDDMLMDTIFLRSAKATCVFPHKVMIGNDCEYKMEINGQTECCNGVGHFWDGNKGINIDCPGCGGSGLKNRLSPNGVIILKPPTALKEGELKSTQKALEFVAPGTDTPIFLREEISKYLDQARAILHLRTSASEVKGSEDMTATGKAIDQRAMYAFLKGISDRIFGIYEFTVTMIGKIRYGENFKGAVVTYPISFELKDEAEYLNDIGFAIERKVPPFVVQSIIYKYLQSLFYNSGDAGAVFELLLQADRLLLTPTEDILIKQRSGLIADWEVILHDSGITLVRTIIREDPGFLKKDIGVQVETLVQRAKDKAAEIKPVSQTPATAQGRIAQILGQPPVTQVA